MPPPARQFVYDPRLARYRDRATGRLIPASQVRAWLDSALDSASVRFRALAEQLRSGAIDLTTWQILMGKQVKIVQLYSAAVAKGGWGMMAPADLGRAGREIQNQLRYLNRFVQQIKRGEQRLDGRFLQRAEAYAQAGRSVFHKVERAEMEVRGMSQERSVRFSGDSCSGCVEQAARDWVAIGSLVPVGSRPCLTNCRCRIEYRVGAPE